MTLIPVYTGEALPGTGGSGDADPGVLIRAYKGAGALQARTFGVTGIATRALRANPIRRTITIYNESANTIYIGGPTLTVAEGFPILTLKSIVLELAGDLWVINDSGTTDTIRMLEELD